MEVPGNKHRGLALSRCLLLLYIVGGLLTPMKVLAYFKEQLLSSSIGRLTAKQMTETFLKERRSNTLDKAEICYDLYITQKWCIKASITAHIGDAGHAFAVREVSSQGGAAAEGPVTSTACTAWTQWSSCSTPCGGTRVRFRFVGSEACGDGLKDMEQELCDAKCYRMLVHSVQFPNELVHRAK